MKSSTRRRHKEGSSHNVIKHRLHVWIQDTRFMTRTYNLLTASQGDLGDMMDEYSIYPE